MILFKFTAAHIDMLRKGESLKGLSNSDLIKLWEQEDSVAITPTKIEMMARLLEDT